MQRRPLGGIQVPVIGMGTWKTFDVRSDADVAARTQIMGNCVAHGVTFVDSSPMYGRAEEVVGLTTEGRRAAFQFATKVWCRGKEEGEVQIARSFELMKTDYIDVFQVHNLLDWRTHLPTLERLKDEGKIGLIGASCGREGDYPELMEIMRSGRIKAIQVRLNVIDRACEAQVLPLAEELGIGVIVMEPLKSGRYVNELRRSPELGPLEEAGIRTWGQALLAWVVGDSRVSVAIPATSRAERIAENAVAGEIGPLPQELRDHVVRETERCL